MSSRESVLHDFSKKYNVEPMKDIKLSISSLDALETMLNEVFSDFLPKQSDYDHRRALVNTIGDLVNKDFGNVNDKHAVEAFGSFIMDMFTADSDLDLSIKLSTDSDCTSLRNEQIAFLRKFAKVLYELRDKGGVQQIQPILSARVPIVKFMDSATRIECDISVDNNDGVLKSLILFLISSIDVRFKILTFLLKIWAKAHDINSSKDHTLNSLSVALLVMIHLQTREPPILPPLSAILEGGNDLSNLKENVQKFKDFGQENKETVAELFVCFFNKLLSLRTFWKHGLCASTFDGSWICSKPAQLIYDSINVEDFIKRSENCARAVNNKKFNLIYQHIQTARRKLLLFSKDKIDISQLKRMFFNIKAVNMLEPKKNPTKIKLPKRKKLRVLGITTTGRTAAISKPGPVDWDALIDQQNNQIEAENNWKRHSEGAVALKRKEFPGEVEAVASTIRADNAGFHPAIPPSLTTLDMGKEDCPGIPSRLTNLDASSEDPQKNHVDTGIHTVRMHIPCSSSGAVSIGLDLRKKARYLGEQADLLWHQQNHPYFSCHMPPALPHQQQNGFGWQIPRPPFLTHEIYNGQQQLHLRALPPLGMRQSFPQQSYPHQHPGDSMQQSFPQKHPSIGMQQHCLQQDPDIGMQQNHPQQYPGIGMQQPCSSQRLPLVPSGSGRAEDIYMPQHPPQFGNPGLGLPHNWHHAGLLVYRPNQTSEHQLYHPPKHPFRWP